MKKILLVILVISSLAFTCPLLQYGDLNCDCRVDLQDLAILMKNWTRKCEMANRYYISSTGAEIDFPAASSVQPGTDNFTITFWAKKTAVVAFGLVEISVNDYFGNFTLNIFDGDDFSETYFVDAVTSVFAHYSLVVTRGEAPKLYINGIEQSPVNQTIIPSETSFSSEDNKATLEFSEFGGLDDVRIYLSALSQVQIRAIYNSRVGTRYSAAESEGGKAAGVFEFNEGEGDTVSSTVLTNEADLTGTINGTFSWCLGGVPFSQGGLSQPHSDPMETWEW